MLSPGGKRDEELVLPVNSSLSVTLSQDEVREEGRGGKKLEKERRGEFQDRREVGGREGGRDHIHSFLNPCSCEQ